MTYTVEVTYKDANGNKRTEVYIRFTDNPIEAITGAICGATGRHADGSIDSYYEWDDPEILTRKIISAVIKEGA